MNWLDWVILALVGLSTLVSLWRGFVKEALSLAAWVAAFFVAFIFAGQLAGYLQEIIGNDGLRYAAAYVILFASTLVLGAFLNKLLAEVIKATGLSGLDRALGTVFGFARGLLLVVVVVFVLQTLAPEAKVRAVEESILMPHVEMIAEWAEANFSTLLPERSLPWV